MKDVVARIKHRLIYWISTATAISLTALFTISNILDREPIIGITGSTYYRWLMRYSIAALVLKAGANSLSRAVDSVGFTGLCRVSFATWKGTTRNLGRVAAGCVFLLRVTSFFN